MNKMEKRNLSIEVYEMKAYANYCLEKAQQYSDDVQKLFKGEHVADSYRLYK